MGSHPTIYSVLQLHVVKTNHNVKNGLRLENKLNSYRNARSHIPSVIKFVGLSKKKQNPKKQLLTFKYFAVPVNFFLARSHLKNVFIYLFFTYSNCC